MLIRCVAVDGGGRTFVEQVNGEVVATREIPSLSVGTVYRPLAISVRAATPQAVETHYLVVADALRDFPISLAFHAAALFEIVDPALEPGWEVIHQLEHLFISGVPELQDLEGLHDRLLAGDPVVEAIVKRHSPLSAT